MINYRLKIDFSDSKILASDICFVSGDIKSSTLYFDFFDEGKRVDISGYTLSVRAKRSDGVVVASAGKIENNTAIFIPESNLYAVPGEVYIEIALSDATGKYATTKVIVAEVIEGLGEAAIDGADNLNVYVTLLNEAVLAKDTAKAAAEVAKAVHPKIINGVWWIYDAQKGEMVSSGIKAEGTDGYTPQKNIDYFDGEKGDKGDKGDPGDTPQKGVDYYTEEEKGEFLDEVLQESGSIYANALKSEVSGSFISVDDVSPVEHTIGAKISGDGIIPESVKVQVSGKNLIPYPFTNFKVSDSSIIAEDLGDGGVRLNGTATTDTYVYLARIFPNNVYMEGRANGFSANRYSNTIWTSCNKGLVYIVINAGTTCDNVIFYPQIEVGSKFTEFEKGIPYMSFTPNADGTIDGLTSISPCMNIFSDTEGVTFDVTYNKDSNTVVKKLEDDFSNQCSNALKGNASGEIIRIDDISPVEHTLGVKVSSGTITDLSTVSLTAHGKNLFNNDTSLLKKLNFIGANGPYTRVGYEIKLPVGTYTIRATPKEENLDLLYIYGYVIDKNNMILSQAHIVVGTDYKTTTFVINEGDKLVQVDGTINLDIKTAQNLFEKFDIMLEFGEKATEYEPYIEPISYSISADGTVEGVKSIYPSTTLLTDTEGVLIDCEYNKDINKAFAELQDAIISLGGNV